MVVLDRVIVSSTDVNRRPGEILDQAEKSPVLVTRGDEPLVIASHDLVRGLVEGDARAVVLGELSNYLARRFVQRDTRDHGGTFDWLNRFDDDDVVTFVEELSSAQRDARAHTAAGPRFDEVIHEWYESSIHPPEYVANLESANSRST